LTSSVAGQSPLQQLNYTYDPVGNILKVKDAAQPVRFFANQQIDPINRYRYDSLYQLIDPLYLGPRLPTRIAVLATSSRSRKRERPC
jgi:hypothetical protein